MDRSTLPIATLNSYHINNDNDNDNESNNFIIRLLKQLADLFDEDNQYNTDTDTNSNSNHNSEYIYESESEKRIKTPKLWAAHKERKQKMMNQLYTTLHAIGMFISLVTLYYNNYKIEYNTITNTNSNTNSNTIILIRKFGMLLFLISYILWYVSKMQLGNSFTIQAKASKLITTGIYSKISNPIYIFSGLAILGYILLINKWIWCCLFIPGMYVCMCVCVCGLG